MLHIHDELCIWNLGWMLRCCRMSFETSMVSEQMNGKSDYFALTAMLRFMDKCLNTIVWHDSVHADGYHISHLFREMDKSIERKRNNFLDIFADIKLSKIAMAILGFNFVLDYMAHALVYIEHSVCIILMIFITHASLSYFCHLQNLWAFSQASLWHAIHIPSIYSILERQTTSLSGSGNSLMLPFSISEICIVVGGGVSRLRLDYY